MKTNLETMEITLNGKRYKVQAIDELTIDDCVAGCEWNFNGTIMAQNSAADRIRRFNLYPTESIAYKVLLYGLLQSVSHKLNGDWKPWPLGNVNGYAIMRRPQTDELYVMNDNYSDACVRFRTKELAEEAIRIFANSKFDLKKLFQ